MSMFGALNRFIARLDADPKTQSGSARGAHGFQVLRNNNAELPLEPWFDFIIGINGRDIDNGDPSLFATEIRNCAGNSVNFGVWSAKGQRVKSFYATVDGGSQSLGLSLQWSPISNTDEVWHILDVTPNSPADKAGLLPYGDYIIGSPAGLIKGESGFGELIEDFLERPLDLHVYNHEYNVTRPVTIQPSRSWGGQGALGCVLGYGQLHRIPAPLDEPPQAPGETLFETGRSSNDVQGGEEFSAPPADEADAQLLVPADSKQFTQPASGPPKHPPRASSKKTAKPVADMDAYFAEGEAKSREQDFAPSPKPGTGLAPPPKAGSGPPRSSSPLKQDDQD